MSTADATTHFEDEYSFLRTSGSLFWQMKPPLDWIFVGLFWVDVRYHRRQIELALEQSLMKRPEVYTSLRTEILTCQLPPGAELREQELAARFGVSKSPVREALQDLIREGLVIVQPRQGYRVLPVSVSDAQDMFGFRQVLELACVAEAARDASDDILAGLNRFRSFEDGGRDDFIAYNRDFHRALARASGNVRMARAACDLIEEMDRLVRMSVGTVRGRDPRKLVDEHCQIIDAVQARNARLAVNLLKAHTQAAERRFLAALEWTAVQA